MQVGKVISGKSHPADREKHLKKLRKTIETLKKYTTNDISPDITPHVDNIYLKIAPYLQTGNKLILETLELVKRIYDRIYEKQQSKVFDELFDVAGNIAMKVKQFSPQRRTLFFSSFACKFVNSITVWYTRRSGEIILQLGNRKFEIHKYNKDEVIHEVEELIAKIHKNLHELAETVPSKPENFKIPIEVFKLLTVRITDDFQVQLVDYAYVSEVRYFYDFIKISKDGKVIETPKSNLNPDNIRSFAEVLERASCNYKILPLRSSFDYWVYNDKFKFWRCRFHKYGCKIYRTKHDPYKAQPIKDIDKEYILCRKTKITEKSVWVQPVKDILEEFKSFFGIEIKVV